jgi:hypothetical protein
MKYLFVLLVLINFYLILAKNFNETKKNKKLILIWKNYKKKSENKIFSTTIKLISNLYSNKNANGDNNNDNMLLFNYEKQLLLSAKKKTLNYFKKEENSLEKFNENNKINFLLSDILNKFTPKKIIISTIIYFYVAAVHSVINSLEFSDFLWDFSSYCGYLSIGINSIEWETNFRFIEAVNRSTVVNLPQVISNDLTAPANNGIMLANSTSVKQIWSGAVKMFNGPFTLPRVIFPFGKVLFTSFLISSWGRSLFSGYLTALALARANYEFIQKLQVNHEQLKDISTDFLTSSVGATFRNNEQRSKYFLTK